MLNYYFSSNVKYTVSHKIQTRVGMSGENLARLNAGCRDIISLFDDNHVSLAILDRLRALIDTKQFLEMLEISTSFRSTFAFIDQDDLTEKLFRCWRFQDEICNNEVKKITQKIKAVDPKTEKNDPELLVRLNTLRCDAEEKKSRVSLTTAKLKLELTIPIKNFKDPSFDAVSFYHDSRRAEIVITETGDGTESEKKRGILSKEDIVSV